MVNVRQSIHQIVVYAVGGEHHQLILQFVPIFVFIKSDTTVFHAALQRPNNTISFLFVAVRKVLNVCIDVVLSHQVVEIRQHSVLKRTTLNTDSNRLVVSDSLQDIYGSLSYIPPTMNNFVYEPITVICHLYDSNCRFIQLFLGSTCVLCYILKPCQVNSHHIRTILRFFSSLEPLFLEDISTSGIKRRQVLLLESKGA